MYKYERVSRILNRMREEYHGTTITQEEYIYLLVHVLHKLIDISINVKPQEDK